MRWGNNSFGKSAWTHWKVTHTSRVLTRVVINGATRWCLPILDSRCSFMVCNGNFRSSVALTILFYGQICYQLLYFRRHKMHSIWYTRVTYGKWFRLQQNIKMYKISVAHWYIVIVTWYLWEGSIYHNHVLSFVVLGWGLLSQFPPLRYFPKCSALPKHTLAIEYHVYIWQVSPQLSCCGTCQI